MGKRGASNRFSSFNSLHSNRSNAGTGRCAAFSRKVRETASVGRRVAKGPMVISDDGPLVLRREQPTRPLHHSSGIVAMQPDEVPMIHQSDERLTATLASARGRRLPRFLVALWFGDCSKRGPSISCGRGHSSMEDPQLNRLLTKVRFLRPAPRPLSLQAQAAAVEHNRRGGNVAIPGTRRFLRISW